MNFCRLFESNVNLKGVLNRYNCYLEHFAPMFVRGQKGSEGVVELVPLRYKMC